MEGLGQVVVSLLFSVLLLGHKIGVVNAIVNSVNRRKEIEEVLGQLQGSQSQLSPALVKHARRLNPPKRRWRHSSGMAVGCEHGPCLAGGVPSCLAFP